MNKALLLILPLIFNNLIFGSNKSNISTVAPVVVEITDTTLDNVYYHQNNFTVPTKLVFTNLTSVNGYVYFHQNTNLVEVDFPLLENTGDYVYFHGNSSLEIINTPSLTTISKYLYVYGNSLLQELNICNLTNILQASSGTGPYTISNNNSTIDVNPPCFSKGAPENLAIDNTSISENQSLNTLIGTLYADSNYTNGNLTYYVTGSNKNKFTIVGNELKSNESFDYEINNQITIKVGVKNQLGEKLEREFIITIINIVNENITTIEITDTSIDNVYYHQNNFTEPTRLVFTNLTSVNGYLYFHQNTNLVEVDFPLLENTGDYVYFQGNSSLEIINTPNLTTISKYLYVYGNSLLQELNICNLTNILQASSGTGPYTISNNNSTIDVNPPCFSKGAPENLAIDNTSISENQNLNSLIGTLSADTNYTNGTLTYYVSGSGNGNGKFTIIDNQLVTASALDFESKNEYTIKIGVKNQLGEKLERNVIINVEDIIDEPITTIEITDTTLENIYYHQNSFISPTKLVFKNLTSVSSNVYFHQNINLVQVDLPLLENTGDHVYFHENSSLEIINAPSLTTVVNYLYVNGNHLLKELNICNISEFSQTEDFTDSEPYYYIKNNENLDFNTTCLVNTTIVFNPVTDIVVQPAPNTLVGTFSNDADTNANIRYYFVDSNNKEVTNDDFIIIGSNVYLAREYEDYTETNFSLLINAIRVVSLNTSSNKGTNTSKKAIANNINEKIALNFSLSIENATLGIQSFLTKEHFSIYPNPAKNIMHIYSKNSFDNVAIFDLTGKQIKIFQQIENGYNISDLSTGIYIVKIKQKGNTSSYFKKLSIK